MKLSRSFRYGLALLLTMLGPPAIAGIPIPKPPTVNARSYILIDYQSHRVLAEQRADERIEPAGLTKLMTAYAAFHALKEKGLELDERTETLIKAMIVGPDDDAALALARHVSGTEEAFVDRMNHSAQHLGLKDSRFENSAGFASPGHYGTPHDLAMLAAAIASEFPDYYRYYSLHASNGLLTRDPTVDGMQAAYTKSAGYCLVASANRDGMRLVSVVTGSPSLKAREDASATLLNYGYTYYETVKVKSRGEMVLKPRVFRSSAEFAAIGPLQDIYITIGKGETSLLKTRAHVNEPLVAPLSAETAVGELAVTGINGDVIVKVPLFPLQPVSQGGLWTRAVDSVMLWFE